MGIRLRHPPAGPPARTARLSRAARAWEPRDRQARPGGPQAARPSTYPAEAHPPRRACNVTRAHVHVRSGESTAASAAFVAKPSAPLQPRPRRSRVVASGARCTDRAARAASRSFGACCRWRRRPQRASLAGARVRVPQRLRRLSRRSAAQRRPRLSRCRCRWRRRLHRSGRPSR